MGTKTLFRTQQSCLEQLRSQSGDWERVVAEGRRLARAQPLHKKKGRLLQAAPMATKTLLNPAQTRSQMVIDLVVSEILLELP